MADNQPGRSSSNAKPNATNEERNGLIVFLGQPHKDGRLLKGAIDEAAEHFPFARASIQCIWYAARPIIMDPNIVLDVSRKKKGNSGRKRVNIDEEVRNMANIPFSKRTSFHALSCATHIPKTTLFRLLRNGSITWHTNSINSLLTDENKMQRYEFCK